MLNMLKSLTILLAMVNPFSCMRKVATSFQYSEPTAIVAMGSGRGTAMSKVSQSITNKVNPPGCTISTNETSREDGSVETRQTLICTKITITNSSGAITSQNPKPGSKTSKADKKIIEKYNNN